MLYEQTKDHITSLNDNELVKYLNDGVSLYDADAVAFARDVYQERKLDSKKLEEIDLHARLTDLAKETRRLEAAIMPLDLSEKIAAFISGIFVIHRPWALLLPDRYSELGEVRRSREMRRLRLLGFLTVILIIIATCLVFEFLGREL